MQHEINRRGNKHQATKKTEELTISLTDHKTKTP